MYTDNFHLEKRVINGVEVDVKVYGPAVAEGYGWGESYSEPLTCYMHGGESEIVGKIRDRFYGGADVAPQTAYKFDAIWGAKHK